MLDSKSAGIADQVDGIMAQNFLENSIRFRTKNKTSTVKIMSFPS
jgi:hypothetical protein